MSLMVHTSNQQSFLLLYAGDNKDTESRLRMYTDWLDEEGRHWYSPNLRAYRDFLLERGLSPRSTSAHLSTVRSHYRRVLRADSVRSELFIIAQQQTDRFAEAKAMVDEVVQRIENTIHPEEAPVKVVVSQDKPDDWQIRLTPEQAHRLLRAPGRDTLIGKRDTAMIATMLCTGIREQELADLEVGDHTVSFDGHLALHVKIGKGGKERVVPYGGLDWCVVLIDEWLDAAGIDEGPLFRGIRGNRVLYENLTARSVQYRLAAYPIVINGELTKIKPHDLRRSYARRMYETGVDVVAIQQNLGHANLKETLGYIGRLDVDKRRPGDIWEFSLV
jgi:site-specific recombinase XerD